MQWLLYGNHPSLVAFTGMTIVLVAGLYGVVSEITFLSTDPDELQIHGPADGVREYSFGHSDSERSLFLPEEEQQGPAFLGVDVPGV